MSAEEWPTTAWITLDGEQEFIAEYAAQILLREDVLFVGGGQRMLTDTYLLVCCNDLFFWGCADYESVGGGRELESLYRAWGADERWGVMKWCCKHRKLRPQSPIEADMRAAGVWDAELEALPKPPPS